jgi:amidohydrolase
LSNITDVLNGLSSTSLWQERVYKDLHAHPELSFHETRTAALAAAKLKELGYEVLEQIGRTGVVGVLQNGTGQTVLARADMDALPVKERTGLPYASTLTVTDDTGATVPVMHACGHDAHVTCLLGAAELLARARRSWSGTFVAVFQPAEEVAGGAKAMVNDGLRDRIPKPDVAFAQHVLAYPAGTVGTQVGPVLSAGDSIRITLHGKGAHGSMPHNSVPPRSLSSSPAPLSASNTPSSVCNPAIPSSGGMYSSRRHRPHRRVHGTGNGALQLAVSASHDPESRCLHEC